MAEWEVRMKTRDDDIIGTLIGLPIVGAGFLAFLFLIFGMLPYAFACRGEPTWKIVSSAFYVPGVFIVTGLIGAMLLWASERRYWDKKS